MLTLHKEAPQSKLFYFGKFYEGENAAITNGDSGAVRVFDIWELVPLPEYGKPLINVGVLRVACESLIDHAMVHFRSTPRRLFIGWAISPSKMIFQKPRTMGYYLIHVEFKEGTGLPPLVMTQEVV